MPIAQIYLVRGSFSNDAIAAMILEASEVYARILYPEMTPPPIERIRCFVVLSEPQHWASGGRLASEGGQCAPYFTCLVLTGRPLEQHHTLLAGMTDVIARHLGCDHSHIRGQILMVEPDNWGIGGTPASIARKGEVDARGAQREQR